MSHGYRICGFLFNPPNQKNLVCESLWVEKAIFAHIWVTRIPLPFRFFWQLSLDLWELWVNFQGYRINGLRFDPPNHKNIVFESLWVEKAIFMHSWIIGSPIPIPLLPKTFFRCLGGGSHVSWQSDLRFAFWPPKPQKLCFWNTMSWESYFHSYLDNQEFDSDSVASHNFL